MDLLITIGLKTPIIQGKRLNFDSLLAGLNFQEYEDIYRAISEVPLEKIGPVFAASSLFMKGPVYSSEHKIMGGLRVATLDPSLFKTKLRNHKPSGQKIPFYPRTDTQRGPHQNISSNFQMASTTEIYFFARGDRARIEQLVGDLQFIGTKRNVGFGEITSVTIEALESVWPHFPILMPDGTPARPLPLDFFQTISNADYVDSFERYAPPYFSGDIPRCAAPVYQVLDLYSLFDSAE